MRRHISLVSQQNRLPRLAEEKDILPPWKEMIADVVCPIAEILGIDYFRYSCQAKDVLL